MDTGQSNPISINDRDFEAFDGTRIAYRVEGSGPALVLTNGLTTTTNFWKYLRPVWLQRHTIVTWDLPGHGNSSPARSAASTDLYAQPRIIAEVMRVAGVARAVQIGWSTGSQVVLEMYRQFPELCESLVLLLGGSGHALDHTRLPLGGSAIDRLARTLSPRAFTRLHRVLSAGFQQPRAFGVGRWLGLIGPRVTREDMQQFTAHIASVDPQSLLLMLRSCQAHDASSVLASMRVPLLIVAGDNDPFAPTDRVGLVMQRAAARCEFLRLHDGTHTALLEQPELIADTVERFIAKAGTRAAAD